MEYVTFRGEKLNAMKYLRFEFKATGTKQVEVSFDKPVSIMIFDDRQFKRYKEGMTCRFYGGPQSDSPFVTRVPASRKYHLIIELGTATKEEVNPKIEIKSPDAKPLDPAIQELEEILGRE